MTSLSRAQSVETTDQPVASGQSWDPDVRVSLGRVIRSEWIKLWSVRSFWIGLVAAFVVAVGFGVLFSAFAGSQPGDGGGPGPGGPGAGGADPVSLSLAGFNLAVLIVGVLGVLLVTSEYGSGLIRATISAVPRRIPVLVAKVIVFGVVTVLVMAAAALVAFYASGSVYSGSEALLAIADPGVLRAVLGTALYTTVAGLIGVALGFLLRSTAGSIGVLFGLLLIVPGLSGLLPGAWGDTLPDYLPSNAGAALTSIQSNGDMLSVGAGAAVLALWVAGFVVAAGVALKYRDV